MNVMLMPQAMQNKKKRKFQKDGDYMERITDVIKKWKDEAGLKALTSMGLMAGMLH